MTAVELPVAEGEAGRISSFAQALSDPVRVTMLAMMVAGRGCCPIPDNPAPEDGPGLCVCEFEAYFCMAQSKVSYHMKKLKDAGLVREEKRGKWNYYSVEDGAVDNVLGLMAKHLAPGEARLAEPAGKGRA